MNLPSALFIFLLFLIGAHTASPPGSTLVADGLRLFCWLVTALTFASFYRGLAEELCGPLAALYFDDMLCYDFFSESESIRIFS